MSFPSNYAIARKPATRDAERTRGAVLLAAAAQISEVGFYKMTISSVAAAAGVSQSGLLHHFPSKAALLTAVLEERDRADGDFLFGDGEVPLGWDAFDALVAMTARNTNRPQWVRLFVRVSAEAADPAHPGHEWIRQHYRSMRAWLRDAVETGVRQGTIRRQIAVGLVVDSTIALLDGIQQQWVIDPGEVSMLDSVREHVRLLKAEWQQSGGG